jgi:hypothetical protein
MVDNAKSRFTTMPRSIQWAALASIGVLLFLVWDSYIAPATESLNSKADAIERNVREVRSVTMTPLVRQLAPTIGPVQYPDSETASSAAFHAVINSVLRKHSASNDSYSVRGSNLPSSAMGGVTSDPLEKLTGDLKFEATVKNAMAIIAALESSPDVEAITSLRMTKDTGGKIKVQMSLESWVRSGGPSGSPAAVPAGGIAGTSGASAS